MCSVVGCYSDRRVVQRFKLPEDPERRLEWVQFLATVNKQRFKESSWTDITICREHFKDDCFESLTPSRSRTTLKPSAVPSLCVLPDETEPNVEERLKRVEPVETTEVGSRRPISHSAESRLTSLGAQGSPVPRDASTDTSDGFISVYGQMHPKNVNFDLITEKAALLQMKGKYVVNENRLLQLFSCNCPLCDSTVKVEKVTNGVFIILNQQCPRCEYRNQWKSQVNASVPAAEDQHLTGGADVTSEIQQAVATDDTCSRNPGVPEIVAVIDNESDHTDETGESSEQGDMDSDGDWEPGNDLFPTRVLQKETQNTVTEEDETGDCPLLAPQNQLCAECGKFFSQHRHHTCEHKIKPYSCNICGKRFVSEASLNSHSRIHDENYKHRCKYCSVTFKTKVDKINHEQTHMTQENPYKCPDCSETFATNMERRIHLEDHRGPPQLKCHICGIEFRSQLNLQRHLAVHTGAKPFKCSVCQRGFSQASHLKSHVRLHTGERPFKCQHCDKCFNHNVSLKSHVQRYHTTNSGCEQKERINERESNTGDAEGNGNKRGTDSELDNTEEEQETDEEVQKKRADVPKGKRRSTGRPKGRPKRKESGNLVLAGQVGGQCSKPKALKQRAQKLKRTQCTDKESREPSDSNSSIDPAEEEEGRSKTAIKNKARTRPRPRNCDSDSEFDPVEIKKKRHGSQNGGKRLRKCKGRPRKNPVV